MPPISPTSTARRSRAGEVGITSGCNQAFCLALMSIAKAGDQVILPRPHYFNHDMWLRMQGVEPVSLDFRPGLGRRARRRGCRQADRPEDARHRADLAQQSDRRGLSARDHPRLLRARAAARHRAAARRDLQGLPAGGRAAARAVRRSRLARHAGASLQLLQGLRADRLSGRRRHRGRRPDRRDREGDGLRLDLPAAARPGSGALRPEATCCPGRGATPRA